MSINIGGFVPGFSFKTNVQPAAAKILTADVSSTITGGEWDCTTVIYNYTGATYGSQYYVQIVPQQYALFGQNPSVNLVSSNSGIATIDNLGNVSFVNTGIFNIIASYTANSYYSGVSQVVPLTNYSGSYGTVSSTTYIPDEIDVSKHVLIVYNTNSTDSLNLKNYYTGHRPLFSGANILGIACPSGQEIISYTDFTGLIRKPIIDFLTGVSGSKPIRYAVMMLDIPTRVSDVDVDSVAYQLQHAYQQLGLRNGLDYSSYPDRFSLLQFQQNTLLASYINFNSYEDCTAYIDKISLGQTGVYLTGNGQNTTYYFEDAGGYSYEPTWVSGRCLTYLLQNYPSVPYVYRANAESHISTGQNLAGFTTWGANGGIGGNYSSDGTFRWSGNNNWYIMHTIESFNGQRNSAQGCFTKWFQSGAFGGTGYENCPVGAVGHVEEPYLENTTNTGYYILWQTGYPFIECAWQARLTPFYGVFGDPFVCK